MSDLYDLLATHLEGSIPPSSANDGTTAAYLDRLSTLSLNEVGFTEPAALQHAAQSHTRNLQALAKRSHKPVIASTRHLSDLATQLPPLRQQANDLRDLIPSLETATSKFAAKYDRSTDNAVLDRRKQAILFARNVDRVSDVLELPSLLSSTVNAAQQSSGNTAGIATSYASALDLHAHVKRLSTLYPQSQLIAAIAKQAEAEMQNLTTVLISSLQSPSLKLAAAMRTIGYLRRVAPELAEDRLGAVNFGSDVTRRLDLSSSSTSGEGALGSLFLICRLQTLHRTLQALEPLRDLADQEITTRQRHGGAAKGAKTNGVHHSTAGLQTEKYLKRYIEIFREQSFNIVSMYKSIFPTSLPSASGHESTTTTETSAELPSPLSTFALHLVDMLMAVLTEYMPNVSDKSTRESLLTQVLYCAGSLGRLGADFGMMLALLEEDLNDNVNEDAAGSDEDEDPEWVQVMKKHRVQASRLEVLARGVGTGRKASGDILSPTGLSAG